MKWWDRSWNPATGCLPCSRGCENCLALKNLIKQGRSTEPMFFPKSLEMEIESGINCMVCSLGDLFSEQGLSYEKIDQIFQKMIKHRETRFFLCTKYPDRLRAYMEDAEWTSNQMEHIWFGVSVEDRSTLWRVEELLSTVEITNCWLSLEPLLEEIQIDYSSLCSETIGISWVMISSETGDNRRSADMEWIRTAARDASAACIPVFINWLETSEGEITDDLSRFPEDLRLRQTPWSASEFSSTRKDLLDGRATIFKRQDGSFEGLVSSSLFFKLWTFLKGVRLNGFQHRGKNLKDEDGEIEKSLMESFELLKRIRGTSIPKSVQWEFIPKELKCWFTFPEDVSKLNTANDKELKSIFQSISKF